MMVAATPDGKTIDYKILAANETPGLGDKASDEKFRRQFAGKAAENLEVVNVSNDKNIQAFDWGDDYL